MKRFSVIVVILIISAGIATGSFVFFRKHQSTVEKVGVHYILPKDEEPAILVVTDADKLSSTFLKSKSMTNDTVLVYQKAKLVIIYRPSVDKVVATGPVILEKPLSK